jgi:hypothetical protein
MLCVGDVGAFSFREACRFEYPEVFRETSAGLSGIDSEVLERIDASLVPEDDCWSTGD